MVKNRLDSPRDTGKEVEVLSPLSRRRDLATHLIHRVPSTKEGKLLLSNSVNFFLKNSVVKRPTRTRSNYSFPKKTVS